VKVSFLNYLFSEMHIRVYNAPLNNEDFFLLADDWGASGAEANGVRVFARVLRRGSSVPNQLA
jgi:hypothetical protein